MAFLLDGAGAREDFRCLNACSYDYAMLKCNVGMTSQVTSPRKIKISDFLP